MQAGSFGNTANTFAEGNHTHNNSGIRENITASAGDEKDLDNYKEIGVYTLSKPNNNDYIAENSVPIKNVALYIEVEKFSGSAVIQTVKTLPSDGTSSRYFYRFYVTSKSRWTNWQEIAFTDIVDSKAPMDHASSEDTYGLGNTSEYGHIKLIDNLNASFLEDGEALSAHQGKVLKEHIDNNKQYYIRIGTTSNSIASDPYNIPCQRGNSFWIYVNDGYGNPATGKVYVEINGVLKTYSLSDGKANQSISSTFNLGDYIINVHYVDTSTGRYLASAAFSLTVE